jgi:hypothetical protein
MFKADPADRFGGLAADATCLCVAIKASFG